MPAAQKRAERPKPAVSAFADLQDRVANLHIEVMASVLPAKAEQVARQWLSRLELDPDSEDAVMATTQALLLAVELETFTPSMMGTTAVDRLARRRKGSRDEEAAFRALQRARFFPINVGRSHGGGLYEARNLTTDRSFMLFDDQLPPGADEVPLIARFCELGEGVLGAVGQLTPLDAEGLAVALSFVRPGKGIVGDHRCAAAVFRHVVRHGGPRIDGLNVFPDPATTDHDDLVAEIASPLDALVARLTAGGEVRAPTPEILDEARRLVSIDMVLIALFKSVELRTSGSPEVGDIYARFAEVQVEALHLRALTGSGVDRTPLDTVSQMIDREVATRDYPSEARDLYRAIRRRATAAKPKPDQADLTRVIERIRGLRAKTIDQGCTEEEAMAAANKVAELLDRYGLSLGEIDLRRQACEGFGIESNRKRTGPLDDCLPNVAAFCDCRAWNEIAANGTIRSVFFGLPADVEAARYLYERVAMAFETETATFQAGDLYRGMVGGGRRKATNSFQFGLGRGISGRLVARKAERDATSFKASGRDLVPVKTSIVEEELAKLGLSFKTKSKDRGRLVQVEAFQAGHLAGQKFQAQDELEEGEIDLPAGS